MYCMLAPPFPKVKCKTPCSLQSVRWFLRWSPVALHIALRGYSQKTKYLRQGGVEPKLGKKEQEKVQGPLCEYEHFMPPSTSHKLQMRSSPAIEFVNVCVTGNTWEHPHRRVDRQSPPASASSGVMITSAACSWLGGRQTRQGRQGKTKRDCGLFDPNQGAPVELPCTDPSGGVEAGIGCLGSRRTVICRASRRVSCSINGVM